MIFLCLPQHKPFPSTSGICATLPCQQYYLIPKLLLEQLLLSLSLVYFTLTDSSEASYPAEDPYSDPHFRTVDDPDLA